jgi:hypothetical protein
MRMIADVPIKESTTPPCRRRRWGNVAIAAVTAAGWLAAPAILLAQSPA